MWNKYCRNNGALGFYCWFRLDTFRLWFRALLRLRAFQTSDCSLKFLRILGDTSLINLVMFKNVVLGDGPFDFWGGAGGRGGRGWKIWEKNFLNNLYSKKKHWPVRKKNLAQINSSTTSLPPQKSNGPPLIKEKVQIECSGRKVQWGITTSTCFMWGGQFVGYEAIQGNSNVCFALFQ